MKIIDTHCDALLKLQIAKNGKEYGLNPFNFQNAEEIETNVERLKAGGVKLQFFAIFIDPDTPSDLKWQQALDQIDLFYTEVLGKNRSEERRVGKEWRSR